MKKTSQSIRIKLFVTLCVVMIMIIAFLVIVSNAVLESFYYYSKKNAFLDAYEYINSNINQQEINDFNLELEKLSFINSFEIVIKKDNKQIFATNQDFSENFGQIPEVNYDVHYNIFSKEDIMYANQNVTIRKIQDKKNGLYFILLTGTLNNGDTLLIRMPIALIQKSVEISNKFLYGVALIAMILAGIAVTWITERFTKPITKLTIRQLRQNNLKLERDIEKKSKIDEMRKQFISDVSHELKTPISLIQGYSEGLIENVNSDEENRAFYAGVILDEANKMDALVKKLLELMKLEYGDRTFHDTKFDIVELIQEVIRNSKVVLEEQEIKVELKEKNPVYVYADDFYMEQVFRNYFTNAIKNNKKINGSKKIKIELQTREDKVRVSVFNTGEPISEENLARIWTRFYKVDKSRNRESGGTGIGLALVKAIMNQYGNDFGVKNKKDGVEFYFEVNHYRETVSGDGIRESTQN